MYDWVKEGCPEHKLIRPQQCTGGGKQGKRKREETGSRTDCID